MIMDTECYEATYGKKPKGAGVWFFKVTGTDGKGAYTTDTIRAIGTLGRARSAAMRAFKASCGAVKVITEVEVLP